MDNAFISWICAAVTAIPVLGSPAALYCSLTAAALAPSAKSNSMRYSTPPMCSSNEEKSSGLTTSRLEGTIAAFICASRRKPATRKSIRHFPVSTVTVSPAWARPAAL